VKFSCDSTLTRACKAMTRSDSTVIVTRLEKILDDSDSTLTGKK